MTAKETEQAAIDRYKADYAEIDLSEEEATWQASMDAAGELLEKAGWTLVSNGRDPVDGMQARSPGGLLEVTLAP